MYTCSLCDQEVYYPIILDCNHIICPICVEKFLKSATTKNGIVYCLVCMQPNSLFGVKEIVIDKEKYLYDLTFPDKKEPE